jgi:hypothetical protein
MGASLLKLVTGLLFVTVGLPCLFFGSLGVTGRLPDTSERENFQQGLALLAVALCTLVSFLLSLANQALNRKGG